MRNLRIRASDHILFSCDMVQGEYEFFCRHKDTFKRMWREQTPRFWRQFVRCFREYSENHGMLKDFDSKALKIFGYKAGGARNFLDEMYSLIEEEFVWGRESTAKGLILDAGTLAAHQSGLQYMGGPLAKDPFYHKDTRDTFRKLFGNPKDPISFSKATFFLPLLTKFAGSVVKTLRLWFDASEVWEEREYLARLERQTNDFIAENNMKRRDEEKTQQLVDHLKGDRDDKRDDEGRTDKAKSKKKGSDSKQKGSSSAESGSNGGRSKADSVKEVENGGDSHQQAVKAAEAVQDVKASSEGKGKEKVTNRVISVSLAASSDEEEELPPFVTDDLKWRVEMMKMIHDMQKMSPTDSNCLEKAQKVYNMQAMARPGSTGAIASMAKTMSRSGMDFCSKIGMHPNDTVKGQLSTPLEGGSGSDELSKLSQAEMTKKMQSDMLTVCLDRENTVSLLVTLGIHSPIRVPRWAAMFGGRVASYDPETPINVFLEKESMWEQIHERLCHEHMPADYTFGGYCKSRYTTPQGVTINYVYHYVDKNLKAITEEHYVDKRDMIHGINYLFNSSKGRFHAECVLDNWKAKGRAKFYRTLIQPNLVEARRRLPWIYGYRKRGEKADLMIPEEPESSVIDKDVEVTYRELNTMSDMNGLDEGIKTAIQNSGCIGKGKAMMVLTAKPGDPVPLFTAAHQASTGQLAKSMQQKAALVGKAPAPVKSSSSASGRVKRETSGRLRRCAFCSKTEPAPKAFKKCKLCMSKETACFYCSRECQAGDWMGKHRQHHQSTQKQ